MCLTLVTSCTGLSPVVFRSVCFSVHRSCSSGLSFHFSCRIVVSAVVISDFHTFRIEAAESMPRIHLYSSGPRVGQRYSESSVYAWRNV